LCATAKDSAGRLGATRHSKYCLRKRGPSGFGKRGDRTLELEEESSFPCFAWTLREAGGPEHTSPAGLPTKV